ncbi:MAG: sensor histidine kinase, partial [Myxococcota bacterium]
ALPVGFTLVAAAWTLHPAHRLDVILSEAWLALCPLLGLLFGWEVLRALRRRAEGSGLMLVCAASALAVGVWGAATALVPEPADWTMRYGVLPVFWVIPVFSLLGFTRRQLMTGERLMQLSEQVLSAQSEERSRLSRELHDGVAQNLQAAKLGLQLAARGDVPQHEALKSATLLVSQSVEELRAVAQDQRSLEGPGRSLAEALQRPAEILATRSGIDIRFEARGTEPTHSPLHGAARDEHLYRIAQEAIGNAIRHGSARSIQVRLLHLDHETRLRVEDDGEGFDLYRAELGGLGMGLSTMRERAGLIGASCEIQSTSSGTCIEVRVRDSA